jgi:catechol 2,3-dioxygenase-like lactoylglutathione lyase family enzyme
MSAPSEKNFSARYFNSSGCKRIIEAPAGIAIMISKNFSVAVVVSDAKKSAEWFRANLGLGSSVHGHWVLVWPKGSTAKIHLCEGKPDPGNTGVAFYVKGATKQAKKMKAQGVRFTKEVEKANWGTSGMFADLDGNEYWLIEGSGP